MRLGRDDGGRARSIVHKSQLTERPASLDSTDMLAQAIRTRLESARAVDIDVKLALLYDVEEVASIPLSDNLEKTSATIFSVYYVAMEEISP